MHRQVEPIRRAQGQAVAAIERRAGEVDLRHDLHAALDADLLDREQPRPASGDEGLLEQPPRPNLLLGGDRHLVRQRSRPLDGVEVADLVEAQARGT